MFNEFNEYDNPENTDYDITVGINTDDNSQNTEDNSITQQEIESELFDLVGVLEDFEEKDLIKEYGITLQEYYHPTKQTIVKVKQTLANKENTNGRTR